MVFCRYIYMRLFLFFLHHQAVHRSTPYTPPPKTTTLGCIVPRRSVLSSRHVSMIDSCSLFWVVEKMKQSQMSWIEIPSHKKKRKQRKRNDQPRPVNQTRCRAWKIPPGLMEFGFLFKKQKACWILMRVSFKGSQPIQHYQSCIARKNCRVLSHRSRACCKAPRKSSLLALVFCSICKTYLLFFFSSYSFRFRFANLPAREPRHLAFSRLTLLSRKLRYRTSGLGLAMCVCVYVCVCMLVMGLSPESSIPAWRIKFHGENVGKQALLVLLLGPFF